MKNFRKIKERDITKLRSYWKSFDNYFLDKKENTYIINYKNISYIMIQQKNKEDFLIEIYKFICNKDFWNIYGNIDKKLYNSKTTDEQLLRRCKRIVFCDRSFYNEI